MRHGIKLRTVTAHHFPGQGRTASNFAAQLAGTKVKVYLDSDLSFHPPMGVAQTGRPFQGVFFANYLASEHIIFKWRE